MSGQRTPGAGSQHGAGRAWVTAVRIFATAVSAVGLVLLARLLVQLPGGSLARELFPSAEPSAMSSLAAAVLGIPVPFHVISVGLILQRRWLSPTWARIAWICVVASGLWLGASLAVRAVLLQS